MRKVATLLGAVVLVGLALAAKPYAESAAFVMDLAGVRHWSRSLLPGDAADVTSRDVTIPTRHGGLPARIYTPSTGADTAPAFIIFPGIHRGGVDEPRLAGFSRRFASAGAVVISVPLPDLREFRVTLNAVDQIEDAALWAAREPGVGRDGRIGLAGVSFSGGLALVAAGRPSLADRLTMAVSFGGYGDLSRVLRFLCTGLLPDGTRGDPHDYGVAVALLEAAPSMVPPDQLEPLRRGVLTFLEGSLHDLTDKPRAQALFADARAQAGALPEPARTLLAWVNDRNVASLGPAVLPHIEAIDGADRISPEHMRATMAPVFLLHGAEDNVIPAAETPLVADYLRRSGNTRVEALLTPLVSHADLKSGAPVADVWRLIGFWKKIKDVL